VLSITVSTCLRYARNILSVVRTAATHHGSCFLGLQAFRDLDDEVRRNARVVGIATVRHRSVRVRRGECRDVVLAVLLQPLGALRAVGLEARRALRTDTDTVADLDAALGLLADTDCLANDLVANTAWIRCWAPAGAEDVKVTATNAAAHTSVFNASTLLSEGTTDQ